MIKFPAGDDTASLALSLIPHDEAIFHSTSWATDQAAARQPVSLSSPVVTSYMKNWESTSTLILLSAPSKSLYWETYKSVQ